MSFFLGSTSDQEDAALEEQTSPHWGCLEICDHVEVLDVETSVTPLWCCDLQASGRDEGRSKGKILKNCCCCCCCCRCRCCCCCCCCCYRRPYGRGFFTFLLLFCFQKGHQTNPQMKAKLIIKVGGFHTM